MTPRKEIPAEPPGDGDVVAVIKERRHRPLISFTVGDRTTDITGRRVITWFTVVTFFIGGVNWIAGRVLWPWPSRADLQKEGVARSAAIEIIATQHRATREEFKTEIGKVTSQLSKVEQRLETSDYIQCVTLRRYDPDLLPQSCTQTIRAEQARQRRNRGGL